MFSPLIDLISTVLAFFFVIVPSWSPFESVHFTLSPSLKSSLSSSTFFSGLSTFFSGLSTFFSGSFFDFDFFFGYSLYYVIFENDEKQDEIKAKLMRFSLDTFEEKKIYDVEMKNGFKEKDENVF